MGFLRSPPRDGRPRPLLTVPTATPVVYFHHHAVSHAERTNKKAPAIASAFSWRREWDSNPRALADKRFSRPPRYDHFDTPARERVMGIEPTYPAWKAGVLPLNYTRIFNYSQVGVTGFEPATSWSQTRRSSQAEPHPDMLFCRFVFVASPKRLRYNITLFHTCQHFFTFF